MSERKLDDDGQYRVGTACSTVTPLLYSAAMEPLGRSLIAFGVILVVVGLVLYAGPSIPWLGRLPGDIRIERPGMRFYFPITTCIVISAFLSLVLWLFSKLR